MASKFDPEPSPDAPEAFYRHHMSRLVVLGTTECGLSRAEARNVAHEVLLASLGNAGRISNMRVWLTATMRAAARSRRESHAGRR